MRVVSPVVAVLFLCSK